MKKKGDKKNIPKWAKSALIVTLAFYLWFLVSTLVLPLVEILGLPTGIYLTFYKMLDFPPAILGFIVCVSIISTITVLLEFGERKELTKIFLTESVSFILYFIIPIIASILLIVFVVLGISSQIPTGTRISFFLKDLLYFTSALFLLTATLNLAIHRIIRINTPQK